MRARVHFQRAPHLARHLLDLVQPAPDLVERVPVDVRFAGTGRPVGGRGIEPGAGLDERLRARAGPPLLEQRCVEPDPEVAELPEGPSLQHRHHHAIGAEVEDRHRLFSAGERAQPAHVGEQAQARGREQLQAQTVRGRLAPEGVEARARGQRDQDGTGLAAGDGRKDLVRDRHLLGEDLPLLGDLARDDPLQVASRHGRKREHAQDRRLRPKCDAQARTGDLAGCAQPVEGRAGALPFPERDAPETEQPRRAAALHQHVLDRAGRDLDAAARSRREPQADHPSPPPGWPLPLPSPLFPLPLFPLPLPLFPLPFPFPLPLFPFPWPFPPPPPPWPPRSPTGPPDATWTDRTMSAGVPAYWYALPQASAR